MGGADRRERSDILWRWHQLIIDHAGDLAAILTAEMGKPFAEAKSEVSHAAAYLQWYAEEANRIYGETISAPSTDRRMMVIKAADRCRRHDYAMEFPSVDGGAQDLAGPGGGLRDRAQTC